MKRSKVPFTHKLVLNKWMLSLFGVESFETLAEHLRGEELEGLGQNNIHRFHHALCLHLPASGRSELPDDALLEYEQRIAGHTLQLNERRVARGDQPIAWKYFQYLALLFTEIYLERYFRNPSALLGALNVQVATYNSNRPEADQIDPFDETAEAWPQLNKLAYWMATGSGKTLLMHANVLQYQHALDRFGRGRELNRILLLTPNEGLSQQHLREFDAAGIGAEIFNKEGSGLFGGQAVEILEVTRLKEEMGPTTVAVDAFEGNNLVLVDEGHRGASVGNAGAWMRYRNALCERGFSFEYSATFGQAVKGNSALTEQYGKSTLCDYSYRYFHADGFGKDYQILNLDQATEQNHLDTYLVACLLTFFQQQRLHRERLDDFRPFNIERPLWVFVGGRVVKGLAKQDASDIIEILRFLARYTASPPNSIERINRVINQGLVTSSGRNLFAGRFAHIHACGLNAEQIFNETLASLFNAPGGGKLHVENLKGATGEIALRLGSENAPFGVINVGDDAKLVELCEQHGLNTGEREFSGSLFQEINQPHSTVNLLIGSKKFTEGWSSWRVSTMGLMNVGKGEGAQIIQLFGRGVRLKGRGMSLKRSASAGAERPKHIELLETLGIFGIQANYMAQFRDFLDEEGLPRNEDRIELVLPVIKDLGTRKLKTIRLKKEINGMSTESGDVFRVLGPVPELAPPKASQGSEANYLQKNQIVLNWYPKIEAMQSAGAAASERNIEPNVGHLDSSHVAFLDLDRVYFELERFKAERGWHNLNISRSGIEALLRDRSWYSLLIPAQELAGSDWDKVRLWEEISVALLKKYMARYYGFRRQEWEQPHLEYRALEEDDPNFPRVKDEPEDGYRVLIDRSEEEIVAKLQQLKASIKKGDFKDWEFRGLKAVWFEHHLYQPLLHLDGRVAEIRPAPLNKGERQFVEDLKAFHDGHQEFFGGRDLYLLRNLSRGRGVGFFEAGNFHPDFILWMAKGDEQDVIFVDPKGLWHLDPGDSRIEFHKTIKDIEQRLGDPSVRLQSFIVSNTEFGKMQKKWRMTKCEMNKRHILFREDGGDQYIGTMLGA